MSALYGPGIGGRPSHCATFQSTREVIFLNWNPIGCHFDGIILSTPLAQKRFPSAIRLLSKRSVFASKYVSRFSTRILVGGVSPAASKGFPCSASNTSDYYLPAKSDRKATQKYEFDEIQDLIISPPSVPPNNFSSQPPTLLEREAEAIDGPRNFSREERGEAMNGLLDQVEKKGVTPGYAFEFVRHAGDLIDDLIDEAKEKCVKDVRDMDSFEKGAHSASSVFQPWWSYQTSYSDYSRTANEREQKINRLLEFSKDEINQGKLDGEGILCPEIKTLAYRVSDCAEKRGIGRLVFYFQLIGMKAQSIPSVLPFVERRIDLLMAKVEFLRSLGVRYNHLPHVLVRWPELLSYQCDSLAHNVDYLVGLGLTHKDIGKMVIKFPQILGRDVKEELHRSVETLVNLGMQVQDVKRLVVRYPILLTNDSLQKLSPIVSYLEQLGVQREHIGTLLIRRPMLLDSDVERDLLPMGNYLQSLNASPSDIDKILMAFPHLFGYDVEKARLPSNGAISAEFRS